jgi:hypothetical protein
MKLIVFIAALFSKRRSLVAEAIEAGIRDFCEEMGYTSGTR